jgi:ribosomal protein S16
MKKSFYNICLLKSNRNTFRVVLKKGAFFEVMGSYSAPKGFSNFELIFLDRERLFFWLSKGVGCELPVYQLLKILLSIKVKQLNKNITKNNIYE